MITLFNITFSSGQSIPYDTVYNVNFTIEALILIYGYRVWYKGVKRR